MSMTDAQRAIRAEALAAVWLARANELREAGDDDTYALGQSQRYLDRANMLRGWSGE